MRNAIYNGPATVFLKEESSTPLFVEATGRSLSAKRMEDREFVNRVCSFSLLDLENYKGDMDAWLAQGLERLASLQHEDREALRQDLRRGLKNNLNVFGEHAFRKHRRPDQKRSIINASLFDVMIGGLARVEEALVAERADALRQAFYKNMDDERFNRSITYGPNTPKEVRTRFRIVSIMLRELFVA